ncbi:hypothetical protein HAX54_035408 [Datura stramonium]|uniref:Uncharacterized protein n=1 Tax=Datura stramonium TaxID=4076 RepID=A0ABS8VIL2_DATST|nr:hypothetical protein [Datura stramonium]
MSKRDTCARPAKLKALATRRCVCHKLPSIILEKDVQICALRHHLQDKDRLAKTTCNTVLSKVIGKTGAPPRTLTCVSQSAFAGPHVPGAGAKAVEWRILKC